MSSTIGYLFQRYYFLIILHCISWWFARRGPSLKGTWKSKGQSVNVCVCVCVRCLIAIRPSADISRPNGTFNQPGVKHAEGQMRRKLHSSGAEITLCCLFAWFFCAATRRHPSEPQLVFCNLLFLLFCVFDVERLCVALLHMENKSQCWRRKAWMHIQVAAAE